MKKQPFNAGCFFIPAPPIFQAETAFAAPALYSQDGVILPSGRMPLFTRLAVILEMTIQLHLTPEILKEIHYQRYNHPAPLVQR